jgi:hypothetical protein
MSRLSLVFAALTACVLSACSASDPAVDCATEEASNSYLFIGHTRVWVPQAQYIDSVSGLIDYASFDMVLLGGDVVYDSSKDDIVLQYLDSIYGLSEPTTLWALGNHDNTDIPLLSQYTKRPAFYASHRDGITFLVTYTNDEESSFGAAQMNLIASVCDTISASSHLILLEHKLTFMTGNPEMEAMVDSVPNGLLGPAEHEMQPNNFYSEVVPELRKAQDKGVQVLCIAGDIGLRATEYEQKTTDGIIYLASGISNGDRNGKVLVFNHCPKSRKLEWEFQLMYDLVSSSDGSTANAHPNDHKAP